MAVPNKVSREAYEKFQGERWNAMISLLSLSELDELTPIQRSAHLAYWYMSEVHNGGHWQYFCNLAHYDHIEVIDALREVGAKVQAEILSRALAILPQDGRRPETIEQFIDGYDEVDLFELDQAFNVCTEQVEQCLEEYLDRYESEFIEWIP